MELVACIKEKAGEWNTYVDGNDDCWIYHHFGWKSIIESSYKHECFFLASEKDGKISGILPLALVKSRLFGNSLTSLPFLDSSGLVAFDSESEKALLTKAMEMGRELKVDYLDLRQTKPLDAELQTDTRKVSLTMNLGPDHDRLWKALSSERRNRVRKAKKSGLSTEIGHLELLPIFYQIWAENMRDLGSPAHSYSFFENILREFKLFANIILVKREDKYIGGAICFGYKQRFGVPWVSSLRRYFKLYPNNILYWDAMLYAIDQGHTIFDFGRSSKGSGTYRFKTLWGAKPQQLHWQFKYYDEKTHNHLDTEKLKYRIGGWIWKRLPLALSKKIGPRIRKQMTV